MGVLTRFLNIGGVTSVALGGMLALVGLFKGKEARQLEAAALVPTLAALKQLLGAVPLLVAITGRVWSNKPLKGELTDKPAAIVQVTEERVSERRNELYWVKESDPVRSVIREAEWGLEEGGVVLPVQAGQDARGGFLEISDEQFLPSGERLPEWVLGQFTGKRFLGTRKVERVLPLGVAVTAVGELAAVVDYPSGYPGAVRQGGQMYVLREPRSGGPFVISRQLLPELIASLKATSHTCNRLSGFFIAVGTGMLLLSAAHQAGTWWRRRQLRARVERARQSGGAAAAAALAAAEGGAVGGSDRESAEGEGQDASDPVHTPCVVCISKNCDVVFPCGHMVVCSSCAAKLNPRDRCPMCRERGRPIRVYRP